MAGKVNREQSPAYLALQANYQTTSTLKAPLADEINIKEGSELNCQVELTEANVQSQQSQSQIATNEKKLLEQQQKINQLEIKNQELKNSLITAQEKIKLYQKEVSSLKSQVMLTKEGQENILNRFNATREKQEKDNNQVRETIKYLRDENNDMITQNNIQKQAFIDKTSELEHKLIEYRLKFEYAQKQLTQNS